MRKLLKWIGILGLALVFLLVLAPGLFFRVPEPVRSGTLALPDLIDPVTVVYDSYAVPHIYAENEHDLFYAAGYIMASERLFQMDLTNRAIQGRLAEMNAEMIGTDKYLRTWGFHHIGTQMAEIMDPDTKRIIQWGCDGINAYINEHLDNLPLEFRLLGHQPLYWDPSIVCGFDRLMAHNLIFGWERELAITRILQAFGDEDTRDLFPGRPMGFTPPSIDYLDTLLVEMSSIGDTLQSLTGVFTGLQASNSWVVSGDRTASGSPLLANDMHLGYSQPPVWYEMHLVGGRFNVRGLCFPGPAMVIAGHNEQIAWGFTALMVDDVDLYLEEINPLDSSTYLYRGEWVPFTMREELIRVQGGDPVTYIVRETVHGPVISDISELTRRSGQCIAMRWKGQDITDDITPFLKLNLARNWDDFTEAARLFAIPSQNVVYADSEGNIGWRPFAQIAIRKGAEYLTVLPGASGEYDWQGYVPFDELPFSYNPASGYIVTANNQTIENEFPYYVTAYWDSPYRAQRISELLTESSTTGVEAMVSIQNDVLSVLARDLVPHLLAAFGDTSTLNELEPQASDILDTLARWDCKMDVESVGAAVFTVWFEQLCEVIFLDEMEQITPDLYRFFITSGFLTKSIAELFSKGESSWFDNVNTAEVENRDVALRQAFDKAIAQLIRELGNDVSRWSWGRLHTLTHEHAIAGDGFLVKLLNRWLDLSAGPFSVPGSHRTVNAINYEPGDSYSSSWGPSQRTVIDLSNLDNSCIVLPTGQSGNPFSPYYTDQVELYNAGQYRTVAFSREAVDRSARSNLVLQP